jgi:hypothetical protein
MWRRWAPELRDGMVRGVSGQTKKHLKLDTPTGSVKGGETLHNPSPGTMFEPITAIHVLFPTRLTACDLLGSRLMNDADRLSQLRHDLSNPLSALLAETQLLLLNEAQIDPETLTGLKEIEALAIRMRAMLREL